MTLDAQTAFTPPGNPVAAPIPVAPVVAIVILVRAVLTQSVGVDDGAPAAHICGDINCSGSIDGSATSC